MSLNTNGWDLIYNIKFSKANTLLNTMFGTDITDKTESFQQLNALNSDLATELAGGFATGVTVKSFGKLADYTPTPIPTIQATQSGFTQAALGTEAKGILKISITSPPTGTNLDLTKYEVLNAPTGLVYRVLLRVNRVDVAPTPINNYPTLPTLNKFNGGGGDLAAASINDDSNGKITSISVSNKGEGYTSAPTFSLVGGVATVPAQFTVVMEPYIEILNPGGTTTPMPTNIQLKDNNPGGSTYNTTVVVATNNIKISTIGVYASDYLLPPIVYMKGSLATGFNTHSVFYSSFLFTTPAKNIVGTDVKANIKKCFGVGLSKIISKIDASIITIDGTWVDAVTGYKPSTEPTATTIKDYCLALVDDFLARLYEKNKNYAQSSVLKMIRSNITYNDATAVFNDVNIKEFKAPAINLLKAYARFFPSTTIGDLPYEKPKEGTPELTTYPTIFNNYKNFSQTLIDHEKGLIKNRVLSNVLWIDDQIFYNLDGSELQLSLFDLASNQERFITCMIQLLKSLVPNLWHYSFKSCTIQNTGTILTSTKRKYDRLKLITGPLQFREGGNDNIIKMELPIRKLVAILGDKSAVYPVATATANTDVGDYKLPLVVNAGWLRSGFKKDFKSLLNNAVTIDLTDAELDKVINDKFLITDANSITIVKSCLHRLINESIADAQLPTINTRTIGFNLYDEYLAIFNELLMVYGEALPKPLDSTKPLVLTDSPLAWMFPTAYTMAVKDDANIPTILSNSVLSLCCMINGNPNNNTGYVDINAIPDGATSAIVIERSVFGANMVAPKIGKEILQKFDKPEKGDVSFDKLGAYTMINKEKSKFRYADFITSQTYIGIVPIVDWFSSLFGGIGYPIYRGTVPEGNASININEDHINFRVKDAEYMYSLENWPKITQDYIITLKYDGTPKILNAKARLIDAGINYFHTDFVNQLYHILAVKMIKKKKEKGKPKLIEYFPYFQDKIKALLKSTNTLLKKVAEANRQQQIAIENNQQIPELQKLKKKTQLKRRQKKTSNVINQVENELKKGGIDMDESQQGLVEGNYTLQASIIAVQQAKMFPATKEDATKVQQQSFELKRDYDKSEYRGKAVYGRLKDKVFSIIPNKQK